MKLKRKRFELERDLGIIKICGTESREVMELAGREWSE